MTPNPINQLDDATLARIFRAVRKSEAADVTGTPNKNAPQGRFDLLTAYNAGDTAIPQYGICYVVSIHSDGIRCAVAQCAYGAELQVAVACGEIAAGAVGKVSMAVGQRLTLLVGAGSYTAGTSRIGAVANSYAGTADKLGPFLCLSALTLYGAETGYMTVIRTDPPAAPKLVYDPDGALIGAYQVVGYGLDYGVAANGSELYAGCVDITDNE